MNDHATVRLKQLLDQHNIATAMIVSNLGCIDQSELAAITDSEINKPFLVANYFGAQLVRVHCGIGSGKPDMQAISDWMSRVSEAAIRSCTIPVFEITPGSILFDPGDIAVAMKAAPKWRLLYDPTQLLLRRAMDPYTKYWVLLRSLVCAVDLRDIKIGQGPRPIGSGDCKWDQTLSDRLYTGFYFVEPGLGRRYSDAVTTEGTFELALEEIKKHF